MSKANNLKKKLFKTRTDHSIKLLSSDFGHFPPKPLDCNLPEELKVDVLYVNGWFNKLLYTVYFLWSSMRVAAKNDPVVIQSLVDTRGSLIEFKQSFCEFYADKKAELSLFLTSFKGSFVAFKALLEICIFPALLLLVLSIAAGMLLVPIYKIVRAVFGSLKRFYPKQSVSGQHCIEPNMPSEIVIFDLPDKSVNFEQQATISHEHIHYLQRVFYDHNNYFPLERKSDFYYIDILLENCDEKIAKKIRDDLGLKDYLNYLFGKEEVEARIHEVLLSYYRYACVIPCSAHDFLTLLIDSSKKVQEVILADLKRSVEDEVAFTANDLEQVEKAVEASGKSALHQYLWLKCFKEKFEIESESSEGSKSYQQRSAYALDDLVLMFKVAGVDFIANVMPLLYANLLSYYGDNTLSEKVRAEVNDIGLYERMYGHCQAHH